MHRLWLLIKVQLRTLGSSSSKNASRGGIVGLRIAQAFLGLLMACYAAGVGVGLAALGADRLLVALAVLVATLCGAVFSFIKAPGMLYEAGDYDLLMSMPVSKRDQVIARLASLYLTAVELAALMVIPMGVAALVFMGVQGIASTPLQWVVLLSIVAFGPVPGFVVAIFLSALITAVLGRLRHGKALTTLASVLVALVAVVASFALNAALSGADYENATLDMLVGILAGFGDALAVWPFCGWVMDAWVGQGMSGWAWWAVFVLVNLALGAVLVEGLAHTYTQVVSAINARSQQKRGKATKAAELRSPFQALCRKEAGLVFDNGTVVANDLISLLLLVIFAALVAIVGLDGIASFFTKDSLGDPSEAIPVMVVILPWIMAFIGAMAPPAAIAISLEGQGVWLMETLPIDRRLFYGAKLAPWLAAAALCALISAVLLLVGGVPASSVLLCFALTVVLYGFCGLVGMTLDERHPNFEWVSATALAKQSLPIGVCIFLSMGICLAMGLVCGLGYGVSGWDAWVCDALSWAAVLVLAAASWLLFRRLEKRPIPYQS